MNSIDPDLVAMLNKGLDLLEEDDKYIGMVVGNQGENFCVGANLMLVFMAIQQAKGADNEKEAQEIWNSLDTMVAELQATLQRLTYSPLM